jgi:integrase
VPEVNLVKKVKTEAGWRFVAVEYHGNGKVKPDPRPPTFYLEWREDGKRKREAVGKLGFEAIARRERKQRILAAQEAGIQVTDPDQPRGTALAGAIETYLEDVRLTKKPKTYAAYKSALDYFAESCKKQSVEEIDRRDLLQYTAFLRDKKQSPRSVYNKFEIVMTFLKAQGVRGIVNKNDWPRYVEQEPEVYENEELDGFFKACDEEERVLFETFLMTGMREQELMHLTWRDIDLNHGIVRVRHKPEYGWTPKAYKEREIPIPDKLVQSLKAWKETADADCPLVFPNSNCSPNGHFLRMCKAVAKRAELPEDDFWLHKFRSTFAARALRSGVDLRTVQMWMGHTDLESTMRYLKPNRGKAVRAKVNAMFD